MISEPEVLATLLREEIYNDLLKIENRHRDDATEWRRRGQQATAEREETLANTVRVCMVTAQVAVTRILDPSAMKQKTPT